MASAVLSRPALQSPAVALLARAGAANWRASDCHEDGCDRATLPPSRVTRRPARVKVSPCQRTARRQARLAAGLIAGVGVRRGWHGRTFVNEESRFSADRPGGPYPTPRACLAVRGEQAFYTDQIFEIGLETEIDFGYWAATSLDQLALVPERVKIGK